MDPFVEVKRDVEQSLQKANELYKKWNLNKRPDEAKWQAEQLKTILSSIDDDIEDLDETIRAAEANPARFNLHPSELSGRRDFVGRTRNTISQIKTQISNREIEDNRNSLLTSKNNSNLQPPPAGSSSSRTKGSNSKLYDNEQQQQQMLFKQQDEQLEGVASTVTNMKEIASVMGRELEDQTRLLDDMEVQVDTTQGKLQHGVKKMNEFIKANSSSKQQWTIACLIIVLVILLVYIIVW